MGSSDKGLEETVNELFDNLVKSRFIEMFENDNYQKSLLKNVCKHINGDRGKNYPSANDFIESGVPFVNAGHLNGESIDYSDMNYISEEKYEKLNSGKMKKGDILYCLRGSIGKMAISDTDHAAIASSLVILRTDDSVLLPRFLLLSLDSVDAKAYVSQCRNGSTQPNLSAESLMKYQIRVPPIALQKQLIEFVKQVDKSKFEIKMALEKITAGS